MRESRSIMGMPVLLEIGSTDASQKTYEDIFDYLRAIDEQFSPYKDTSEVSLLNVDPSREQSKEMAEIQALAEQTTTETNGYFSVMTPEGRFDPSGIVKGWAINAAANHIREKGYNDFYLEIAGDIQTSGVNREGNEWSIGIRHPLNNDQIVKVIYPKGMGVATSGTYERGSHIYNPHAPKDIPRDYVSLTVIGPNVYEADRFATAAFAMGKEGMHFIENHPDLEGYAISADGTAVFTSGFTHYT